MIDLGVPSPPDPVGRVRGAEPGAARQAVVPGGAALPAGARPHLRPAVQQGIGRRGGDNGSDHVHHRPADQLRHRVRAPGPDLDRQHDEHRHVAGRQTRGGRDYTAAYGGFILKLLFIFALVFSSPFSVLLVFSSTFTCFILPFILLLLVFPSHSSFFLSPCTKVMQKCRSP